MSSLYHLKPSLNLAILVSSWLQKQSDEIDYFEVPVGDLKMKQLQMLQVNISCSFGKSFFVMYAQKLPKSIYSDSVISVFSYTIRFSLFYYLVTLFD